MVFQGTKKTNKGHQARLQTLSFDLYMKNQGRGGGGRATDETMGLYRGGGGGGGLQTRPWISARRWLGHSRYHGCLPGVGGGGGLQKRPWVSIGGRRGYRRDHGPLSGVGGLQKRPWVSIRGRGVTDETMGLYRGEGGYRRDHGSLQGGGGAKQILWVSSRGWGAIRGGHHLHLFWWVLSLYSSFDQFPKRVKMWNLNFETCYLLFEKGF